MNMGKEVAGFCMSLCMGETLAVTQYFGDMQSEEVTPVSRNTPSGAIGFQPTYKTFNPKFILSASNAGTGMEQRLREWSINKQPNLRPIPWASINP